MKAEEILKKVHGTGYCVFELQKKTIEKIRSFNLDQLDDGFHVNNDKQMALFKESPDISSIVDYCKKYLETLNYKLNGIHISRVVVGGSKEKYRTHFDSHILTLVIPILIPDKKLNLRGQLYLVPNHRRQPRTDVENIFTKLLAFKYRGEKNFERVEKLKDYKKFDIDVGQAILFNGSRSLHGNLENKSKSKRVTFIYHMTDPFPKGVGFWMRKIREKTGLRS